jgi:mannitol/fructose-specific phosphotransferase system IIA component (Ntr-type)
MTAINDESDFQFSEVNVPATFKTWELVIRFLLGELVRVGKLTPETTEPIFDELMRREGLGSTAVGRGVAIPHVKSELVTQVAGIVGKCTEPVDWPSASGNNAVRTVCLLIAPKDIRGDWLKLLESVSKYFKDGG